MQPAPNALERGVPIASQPYLKHCQGRGFADDALTPREDGVNGINAAARETCFSRGTFPILSRHPSF